MSQSQLDKLSPEKRAEHDKLNGEYNVLCAQFGDWSYRMEIQKVDHLRNIQDKCDKAKAILGFEEAQTVQ